MTQTQPSILVIEDNPGHFRILQKSLERQGIHLPLIQMEDGKRGLDFLLRREEFAAEPLPAILLMVLDLNLPRITGAELLKTLSQHAEVNRIPRVIFTTSDEPEDLAECKQYGFLQYFVKPPKYDELAAIINRLLAEKSTTALDTPPQSQG